MGVIRGAVGEQEWGGDKAAGPGYLRTTLSLSPTAQQNKLLLICCLSQSTALPPGLSEFTSRDLRGR